MSVLSARLRELRLEKGWGVRALAEMVSKTPGYISRIEGRGELPSAELLCRLAELYGVAAEDLLDLAKKSQLLRAEEDIDARHRSALKMFRKETK